MTEISIQAYAKINLTLDVLNKRADGYHDVKMIMQAVNLADDITFKKNASGVVTCRSNLPYLPQNDKNLCIKAAELLRSKYGIKDGVDITLQKNIPVAAGLAGGSSNAAATLRALCQLWELTIPADELSNSGKSIGADVPYCLLGGTALAEGIGEKLTVLPPLPDCAIILCKPGFSVSTAKIYGALDMQKISEHPDTQGALDALAKGDLRGVLCRLYNVLEKVTIPFFPMIREIKNELLEYGAIASLMSGSGPTVFGVFEKTADAENALLQLTGKFPDVILCRPHAGN